MNRHSRRHLLRGTLALVGFGVVSGCGLLRPPGQQPAKVPRVGFLAPGTLHENPRAEGLRQGLRDHGYVEGESITIEWRFATATNQLPALAGELAGLGVDVIVVHGTEAAVAAKAATAEIPVVLGLAGDPVGTGLVESLARPGGNVTGQTNLDHLTSAKRLELLKEAIPGATRIAVFANPNNPQHLPQEREIKKAAEALGLELRWLEIRVADDLPNAFAAATRERADALLAPGDAFTSSHHRRVVELAAAHRLPASYNQREFVEAGGLMGYGPSRFDTYRRAAVYVDKILKGAKPSDLPVEQVTTFELVINLKAAQALGLTIPQSVLMQATEIIQ